MPTALTVILIFLILLYCLILSLRKPIVFLWIYVLASTQFLGLFDLTTVEIEGVFNVILYLNIITMLSILISGYKKGFFDRTPLFFLAIVSALFTFGVIYPTYMGYSNIVSSVTDGKDLLCYFLLGYLLVNKDKIRLDHIYNLVGIIGMSLSIIVIISSITEFRPPAYLPIYPKLGSKHGIHIYYATFISLALFFHLIHILKKQLHYRNILKFVLLITGLTVQGHRSVFLSSLLIIFCGFLYLSSFDLKAKAVGILVLFACFFYDL